MGYHVFQRMLSPQNPPQLGITGGAYLPYVFLLHIHILRIDHIYVYITLNWVEVSNIFRFKKPLYYPAEWADPFNLPKRKTHTEIYWYFQPLSIRPTTSSCVCCPRVQRRPNPITPKQNSNSTQIFPEAKTNRPQSSSFKTCNST